MQHENLFTNACFDASYAFSPVKYNTDISKYVTALFFQSVSSNVVHNIVSSPLRSSTGKESTQGSPWPAIVCEWSVIFFSFYIHAHTHARSGMLNKSCWCQPLVALCFCLFKVILHHGGNTVFCVCVCARVRVSGMRAATVLLIRHVLLSVAAGARCV